MWFLFHYFQVCNALLKHNDVLEGKGNEVFHRQQRSCNISQFHNGFCEVLTFILLCYCTLALNAFFVPSTDYLARSYLKKKEKKKKEEGG